jgi:hypothetical protein
VLLEVASDQAADVLAHLKRARVRANVDLWIAQRLTPLQALCTPTLCALEPGRAHAPAAGGDYCPRVPGDHWWWRRGRRRGSASAVVNGELNLLCFNKIKPHIHILASERP